MAWAVSFFKAENATFREALFVFQMLTDRDGDRARCGKPCRCRQDVESAPQHDVAETSSSPARNLADGKEKANNKMIPVDATAVVKVIAACFAVAVVMPWSLNLAIAKARR